MQVIDPRELNDLAEFASRGGLGSTVATTDCVAESADQLMYITGDTLILLREEQEVVIAACEGVVGWIRKGDVDFGTSITNEVSHGDGNEDRGTKIEVPNTIISSPTPPTKTVDLPSLVNDDGDELDERGLEVDHRSPDSRRASGPFDLGTPNHSPGLEQGEAFFEKVDPVVPPLPPTAEAEARGNRASVLSTASSDALGGIGGFMMGSSGDGESFISRDGEGDGEEDGDTREDLKDDSPPGTSVEVETPYDQSFSSSTSAHPAHAHAREAASLSPASVTSALHGTGDHRPDSTDSWDIYGDYARESMYYKRATRDAKAMSGMDEAFNLAKALRDIPTPPSKIPSRSPLPLSSPTGQNGSLDEQEAMSPSSRRRKGMPLDLTGGIPELKKEQGTPAHMDNLEGRSVARELMMKIQKDRQRIAEAEAEAEAQADNGSIEIAPAVPPRSASRTTAAAGPPTALFVTNAEELNSADEQEEAEGEVKAGFAVDEGMTELNEQGPVLREETQQEAEEAPSADDIRSNVEDDVKESENSTIIDTPLALVSESAARQVDENTQVDEVDNGVSKQTSSANLLASPIPLDITQPGSKNLASEDSNKSPQITFDPPESPHVNDDTSAVSPAPDVSRIRHPMIDAPPRGSPSPDLREPKSPWTPSSPASPHSVQATRQAVQVARSVSESHATPGRPMPTLVGRTDVNLLSSKGPVPITFLVDGAGIHRSSPTAPAPTPAREGLGLGLPSTSMMGRISPVNSIASSTGLGSVNGMGTPRRAATSPLAGNSPRHPLPVTADIAMDPSSRFPTTSMREATERPPKQTYTPVIPTSSPQASNTARMSAIYPNMKKGRSRSFGATMARAMGRGKKDKEKEREKVPPTPLVIDTSVANGNGQSLRSAPPMPTSGRDGKPLVIANLPPSPIKSTASPLESTFASSDDRGPPSPSNRSQSPITARKASAPAAFQALPTAPGPPVPASPRPNDSPNPNGNGRSPWEPPHIPLAKTLTAQSIDSTLTSPKSYPSPSAPASTSSFRSPKPQMSRKASNTIQTPSPAAVSHTDFAEETVKADGLDFEMVQPKRGLLSPDSFHSSTGQLHDVAHPTRPEISRSETIKSDFSAASGRSIPLPETDEWGFLKDQSPTPEMFQSRNTASDHRAAEGKWLSIISTPMPADGAPKKVRKLAAESGVPASLRGKVWAWFLAPHVKRDVGDYMSLVTRGGELDERTITEINKVYSDHSVFAGPFSTGTADLRSLLVAYQSCSSSSSTVTPLLALIAGMLIIHCVAEDAFHILIGIVDGLMVDYFPTSSGEDGHGLKVDTAVFVGLLAGSEKPLSRKFKELGVHPRSFLSTWYNQLFIRCLPWPTALRVIDGLLAEGPRFLLIVSLSILTLSRERIMAFKTKSEVMEYLEDLPQDALLLPENFMKACSEVRFKDEDYKRLRAGVEKEISAA